MMPPDRRTGLWRVELQAEPGNQETDLSAFHFGLLFHVRQNWATATRELFTFRALRDRDGTALNLCGVEPDRERIEEQRASGSDLDQRLIRASAFRIALAQLQAPLAGELQRVFVLLRPRSDRPLNEELGLRLRLQAERTAEVACRGAGPAPQLLWTLPEWSGADTPDAVAFRGDIDGYVDALSAAAERSIGYRRDRAASAAQDLPSPDPLQSAANAPSDEPATPAPAAAPCEPPQRLHGRPRMPAWYWAGWLLMLAGAGWLAYANGLLRRPQTGSVEPDEAVAAMAALPLPPGLSPATPEQLRSFSYAEHAGRLDAALAALRDGRREAFQRELEWLRAHKPSLPPPPRAAKEALRQFHARVGQLLEAQAPSRDTLDVVILQLEQLLLAHYGDAAGHGHLAIALALRGRTAPALVAARQAAVFDPTGADAFVALGVAFAAGGDTQADAAFCAALVLSDTPEIGAERLARIGSAPGTGIFATVTAAARGALARCPRERWSP